MGTDPQEMFGVIIGTRAAARAGVLPAFALEQRHPDGHRWIVLRRFGTRFEAEEALAELQARGEDASRYRVGKVPGV